MLEPGHAGLFLFGSVYFLFKTRLFFLKHTFSFQNAFGTRAPMGGTLYN
jgi:hypothetical protein